MDFTKQLEEYRKAKKYEFYRKDRLEAIRQKYSKLLVLDKILLAKYKIVRFIEQLPRFNDHFINDYYSNFLKKVPGRFRYRTFWEDGLYVYDLREIGPICKLYKDKEEEVMNIYPPIEPYKVSNILRQWDKVNPDSDSGLIFKQTMDYQKAIVEDNLRPKKYRKT